MSHILHIASPPLNAYIDYLYYVDGPMPYPREKIMPGPGLNLKVNFGGAIQAYAAGQAEPCATCSDSCL